MPQSMAKVVSWMSQRPTQEDADTSVLLKGTVSEGAENLCLA